METSLTVFISYSWDSEQHKEWVLNLANYLIHNGINVLLDQYELGAGKDLQYFMESSLEKADKVLMIMTPNYKQKSDERKGGTGFEYSMISQGLYELQHNNKKFIPVLRDGNLQSSAPIYLKSKVYLDMGKSTNFEVQAFQLLRELYERPQLEKPNLGNVPNFEQPAIDPIIEVAKRLGKEEQLQNEIIRLAESEQGMMMAISEVEQLFQKIEAKALEYSEQTRFEFLTERERDTAKLLISLRHYKTTVEFKKGWQNTLKDTTLQIEKFADISNNYNQFRGYNFIRSGSGDNQFTYRTFINNDKKIAWVNNTNEMLTSDDVVSKIFAELMEFLRQEIDDKKNRN